MPNTNILPGIRFAVKPPVPTGASSRADVAVFVGLVARTLGAPPLELALLLREQGWLGAETNSRSLPKNLSEQEDSRLADNAQLLARAHTLLGLPVAVESWAAFEALYAWKSRPADLGSSDVFPCALGLAVFSFFSEGGRKAYIVRTGDPLPLVESPLSSDTPDMMASASARFAAKKLALLDWRADSAPLDADKRIPILPGLFNPARCADPGRRESWIGSAAIFGIEDAAFLLLPDVIECCAGMPSPAGELAAPPAPPEQFKPCAIALEAAVPPQRLARPAYCAPRLDLAGYKAWASAMRHALDMLSLPKGPAHRRDVMLIGAAPLPLQNNGLDKNAERNPLCLLGESNAIVANQSLLSDALLGHSRLQLAYPWIGTAQSVDNPEGLESPDGAFAGVLARTALMHGAFRSAAGQSLRVPRFFTPQLDSADMAKTTQALSGWMGDRICLLGHRRTQMQVLSDATTAESMVWRYGGVARLMGIILRAARYLGQDVLFEPSGPILWNTLRNQIEYLLEGLRQSGAFAGSNPSEAYNVRCDRTSMSQADIDAGRVIATIGFSPAFPVERVVVSLDLIDASPALQQRAA
jgi:uncharacterized protein